MKKPDLPKYAVLKRFTTHFTSSGWYTLTEVGTLAKAKSEVESEVEHRRQANLSPVELQIVKLVPVGKVTSSAA